MINKIVACQLFAYDYKLIDKEGRQYDIRNIGESSMELYGSMPVFDREILYSQIGKDYFILARPMGMLTNYIDEDRTPLEVIQERGKLASVYYIYENMLLADYGDGVNVLSNWEEQYLLQLNFAINLPKDTWKEII